MADSGSGRNEPFDNVISLVAGPIAAVIRSVDQLRRGAEEMMRGIENFNSTMENLNETAARVNRLLNDFEEPIRAMLPQVTRTVKMADDLSNRLSTPIDQVIPGLHRLAETLNNPVFQALPRDLGQFVNVINDLSKRMSPLAQIAEQAGGLFGLRIPGMTGRLPGAVASAAPAGARATAPVEAQPPSPAAAPARPPARKIAARSTTATKAAPRRAAPKKAAAKKTAARKAPARRVSSSR